MRQGDSAHRYAWRGRNGVGGWFALTDALMVDALMRAQRAGNRGGAVAEIGVHHGKMFIALCLGRADGERAYCIDLFADQARNRDGSGLGDLQKFRNNLRRFDIPDDNIVIRQGSSADISGQDVLDAVGPVRFFSVDGGHWREIVENDLKIAERCLAAGGIIALDDFHRPEWPDVSAGYFAWYAQRSGALEPFAIGFNKLYLCDSRYRDEYQQVLARDPALKALLVRQAVLQGHALPVYAEYILPEYGPVRAAKAYLKLFAPRLFLLLRTIFGR